MAILSRPLLGNCYCFPTATSINNHRKPTPRLPPPHVALDNPPPSLLAAKTLQRPHPDDPSLQSTWSHRAWVALGSTSILLSLTKSTMASLQSHTLLEPALAAYIGYLLADLASGVYHWAIDNYGSSNTPIVGAQIHAFQGHHKWPWTITKRQFSNNLHALSRAVFFTMLPLDLLADANPALHAFAGACAGCIMMSQQFHAWAHGTKSRLPRVVVAMQEMGVLVGTEEHGRHHRPPYNNNYCIVSGAWNGVLDESRVFEMLEMVLFLRFGVRPRSWSEPNEEWVEDQV
ncbi:hypothetical protein Scep_012981 [Stephania cephalantha]|uniref:Lipid desaturase domain-containing protein n=1 Tax=Stephania cephalantha TaxID=152367 RepID=A0AAP0JG44_9MAGN